MERIQGRLTQVHLVVLAVLAALGIVAVWALVPDVGLGAVLLIAVSAEALVSVVLYVVERRRHW